MQGQGKGKGIGKILSKEAANSHIYSLGTETVVSQYITQQKKKSEDAEAVGSIPRNQNVMARYGNTYKQAKIVESEIFCKNKNGEIQFKYYISFQDLNRRMDSWIDADDILQVLEEEPEKPAPTSQNEIEDMFPNDENKGMDLKQVEEHETATKIKTIQYVQLGFSFRIQTWYYSPFPSEFQNINTLFFCQNCLSMFKEEKTLKQHFKNRPDCGQNLELKPPGLEIYRDQDVSVFEVSGSCQRIYCENLCLIAKLFLDHKNIRFDCNPFLFYILIDRCKKQKLAGYFSKEFGAKVDNNLSCILIMPHCQRKGYGKFLIEFSYCLSKLENKKGTPERPLSDLGFRSYVSFWAIRIIQYLLEQEKLSKLNIQSISDDLFFDPNDVFYILENFKILRRVPNGQSQFFLKKEYLEAIAQHLGVKNNQWPIYVQKEKLKWIPHQFYS